MDLIVPHGGLDQEDLPEVKRKRLQAQKGARDRAGRPERPNPLPAQQKVTGGGPHMADPNQMKENKKKNKQTSIGKGEGKKRRASNGPGSSTAPPRGWREASDPREARRAQSGALRQSDLGAEAHCRALRSVSEGEGCPLGIEWDRRREGGSNRKHQAPSNHRSPSRS